MGWLNWPEMHLNSLMREYPHGQEQSGHTGSCQGHTDGCFRGILCTAASVCEGLCHARTGKAKYDSKKHALVWKIKKFTGATEHSLVSAVELIATTREKKSWSRPPISMTFQVRFACCP